MLKVNDFKDGNDVTIEEVEKVIDKTQLIHEIKTSKHFRFLPFKNKVIEQIQNMTDEQVREFVREAYPQAKKAKEVE